MRTDDELLYWQKFEHMIRYNKKTKKYEYDAKMPIRAIKSFKAWLKQLDS